MATLVQRAINAGYAGFQTQAGETPDPSRWTRGFKDWHVRNNPDGTVTRRCSGEIGPIHYRLDPFNEAEPYSEIDLDVVLTPGEAWDAACETNGYQVRFWQSRIIGGKTIRYICQYRRAGQWFAMAPLWLGYTNTAGERQTISKPLAVGMPTINNEANHVTWNNCFGPGRHFRYNIRANEFFKTGIIDAKTDLPTPTIGLAGLKLTLLMGVAWSPNSHPDLAVFQGTSPTDVADGDWDAPDEEVDDPALFAQLDTLDRPVWWHRQPRAWDSFEGTRENPGPHVVPVGVRRIKQGGNCYVAFQVAASDLNNPAVVFPVYIDDVMPEEQVGASTDDGESVSGGNANTTNSLISPSFSTSDYATLFRWTTVPIPQAPTINTAAVTFRVNNTAYDDPHFEMRLHDSDDSPTIGTEDVGARPKTTDTAAVAWNATGVGSGWVEAPDISSHVQEVVDRPGWVSNNALSVVTEPQGVAGVYFDVQAWDFTGNVSGAKFNCTYTVAGGVAPTSHLYGPLVGPLGGPV